MDSKLLYGSSIQSNVLPTPKKSKIISLSGEFKGSSNRFDIDEEILSKHSLLIGGTGCGKTTLFFHFVDQLKSKMNSDDVMIIFDSKGDFYRKFAVDGDLILGNSKMFLDKSVKWNIYKEILADGLDESSYLLNIHEICKSIFAKRIENSTANVFFPNAASDLLAAILIAIIRDSINDKELRQKRFFNDSLREVLDYFTADMIIENLSDYPDLQSIRAYIEGENSQSQGVLSELYSVIREIFIGVFAAHGGFSMREFVRNKGKKILFIEYDLSIGNVLTPMYSLLIDLALKEALGRNHAQGNVYLIADEFSLLPYLRHITDGVNFGRSLGLKVLAGLQSIEQLNEVYGKSKGTNIVAGFSSVYAFKPNDITTRNFVTNLFGENLILDKYLSFNDRYVEEKRTGHTVESWDLNSLNVGEAIVGLPFTPPFRFKFDDYKK